jgi:uncharacterized membrane protein YqiK
MITFLFNWWWVVLLFLLIIGYKFVLRIFGVVIVPNNHIGIVNKRFVILGTHRTLPDGSIIALHGEAGYQADQLAPGLHFFLWPWQFHIDLVPFLTIKEGFLGVVESRDGHPLSGGRVLAKKVECNSFQNARQFLENGGERGPQITIIPPGTYRINTALFSVVEEPVTEIPDNKVGMVTTKEGLPLPKGDIAGKEVPGHNTFQDAQLFIDNGGYKGRQEQVMLAGRYFLNPRFATVETVDMTTVPIANVGVVIAYVGDPGIDVTGETFKHGNLVKQGQRGVWVEPLDPGKYPINPYTHKVEIVPTANVVLNWADNKSEAHRLDENLCTITVRSFDGFTFNLDVSQIIHIPRTDAPKVIARFGNMANLVTQVLEPTIGNYFRNAAQGSDAIEFLKKRKEKQDDAKASISAALTDYNVGAVDTLIGDITPPPELMKTLTDRKIAEQEQITYGTQMEAQKVRKNLQQETAMADTQPQVVAAERTVQINDFSAQAMVKKAQGEAQSKTINAEADARVLKLVGDAEGGKIKAVGTAEADVIKLKIASMESSNYAAIEVSKALASSSNKFVPDIVAGGGEEGSQSGGSIVSVLLANLLLEGRKKSTSGN